MCVEKDGAVPKDCCKLSGSTGALYKKFFVHSSGRFCLVDFFYHGPIETLEWAWRGDALNSVRLHVVPAPE